jgi:hypothetical protein
MSVEDNNSKAREADVNTENQLDELFQAEINKTPASSERIENVVKSAKQEAGMRDLFTHMLFRIWMPIMSIGSIFFVFLNRQSKIKK